MEVKCEYCGAVYEDPQSKFCDRCGHKMSRTEFKVVLDKEDSDTVRCTSCGHREPKGRRLCSNCGTMLRSSD